MTLNEKDRAAVLDLLEEMYPDAECALAYASMFELLIAVVLSAQTTDKSVNAVSDELFGLYPEAAALAAADEEDLRRILKRVGLYKMKAKNIKAVAKILSEEFDGAVPGDYEDLIRMPGVGRKTANVVLSVGFGQNRIAVDTHVFRVSNRIGLCAEKDVLKTEFALMEKLPENRWSRAHHSLIWHGRRCCHARKPACEVCGINGYCLYLNKNRYCPGG